MSSGTPGGRSRADSAPRFARLGPKDLPDLLAFHDALHAASPEPGLFLRETEAFFAAHLDAAGRVLGLRDGSGRLRAYGILGLPGAEDEDNFGRQLGCAATDLARVCHLDGCGVDPAWRGRALQWALTEARIRLGQSLGRDLAISVAAPANVASIANLTGAGLEVVALVEKYEALRFLLAHDARRAVSKGRADGKAAVAPVPLPGATAMHRARLASGARGIGVRREGTQPVLLYASAGTTPAGHADHAFGAASGALR